MHLYLLLLLVFWMPLLSPASTSEEYLSLPKHEILSVEPSIPHSFSTRLYSSTLLQGMIFFLPLWASVLFPLLWFTYPLLRCRHHFMTFKSVETSASEIIALIFFLNMFSSAFTPSYFFSLLSLSPWPLYHPSLRIALFFFTAYTHLCPTKYPLLWWYWSVSSSSPGLFSFFLHRYIPELLYFFTLLNSNQRPYWFFVCLFLYAPVCGHRYHDRFTEGAASSPHHLPLWVIWFSPSSSLYLHL